MAKNSEVALLRAQVIKAQRNAGRKLSRLRGLGVNSSDIDPRKDVKLVRRYTKSQLGAQLVRLEGFNSRKTQFVPGARGLPIPKADWVRYQKTEKSYNTMIDLSSSSIGSLRIGDSSMTIAEHYATIIPKNGVSMGGGSMRYHPLNRSSKGVVKPENIDKLIVDLEKRMQPGYQSEQEKRIRDNFDALLKYSGRGDLSELAHKLEPGMFHLIWNFSPVVQMMAENYQAIVDMMSDEDAAIEYSGIEESFKEIEDILEWAQDKTFTDYKVVPNKRNRKKK